MTETWHAVCRDCPEFEMVDEFGEVLVAGRDHQEETGHSVDAGKVDDAA